MERKLWGGMNIRVPDYNLDLTRVGFIYNSLTRTTREEKETKAFNPNKDGLLK